jgi:hypothetical protein
MKVQLLENIAIYRTTSAELKNLYEASEKVYEKRQSGVVLTFLRNVNQKKSLDQVHNRKIVSL